VADSETVRDGEFSGNLGVLYKLSQNVNLYGNVGRAFRAPTLLERFFDGPHDVARDIGNPDLDPETSWNFDTGVKMQLERWSAMASVFYNRIDDYIVKQLNATGDYEWTNFAEVRLYGAEAGLDFQLGHGFSLFATASHVRGRNEETHDDLPAIPPLKARYGLRFDQAFGDHENKRHLWAELSGTSAARQKHPGPNEKDTAGWTRIDFRAGYDLGDRWSLSFAVENLTDKSYHDHLSGAWQLFNLYEQAGRNCKLMATLRF
jgi:hemoglobin/transferrin/lactoferrin receptor protein